MTEPTSDRDANSLSGTVGARLERIRSDPTLTVASTAVGAVLGVALATLHWIGLVLGGVLVGLPARSLGRALASGVGFGLLVVGVFLVVLANSGVATAAIATGTPLYVAVGIALGCSLLGSLVRGVV